AGLGLGGLEHHGNLTDGILRRQPSENTGLNNGNQQHDSTSCITKNAPGRRSHLPIVTLNRLIDQARARKKRISPLNIGLPFRP
ncbi:hypothetical protein, partial [Salmonella enterica]|uniref:hypothetical protein n=1 Tax=Salmonella enterica TaxID=28901 RepID=UPI0032B42DA1